VVVTKTSVEQSVAEPCALGPDDFVRYLVRSLRLDDELEPVTLDTALVDDLQFDSLRLLETIGTVFQLLGSDAEVDETVIEALATFRSLYLYYTTVSNMPRRKVQQGPATSLQPPPLEGLTVNLRPPTGSHFGRLYEIATSSEVAWRWRFRGGIPSLDAFVQTFNSGVLAQFTVTRRSDDNVVGLVAAHAPDLQNGFVSVAVVMTPEAIGTGAGIEAVIMFLNYLFHTWNFHKIYFEAAEFNFSTYASGEGRFFHLEGRLKQHHYFRGRHWDQIIAAVYRNEFFDTMQPFEETMLSLLASRR
jgi:RimJ/RimL family protein N-acetyltransferase/acyl carrier protein